MERGNTKYGKRRIKVLPKHLPRAYGTIVVPEIRLCGKWLDFLGFMEGQYVEVTTEESKITITIEDQSKTKVQTERF